MLIHKIYIVIIDISSLGLSDLVNFVKESNIVLTARTKDYVLHSFVDNQRYSKLISAPSLEN